MFESKDNEMQMKAVQFLAQFQEFDWLFQLKTKQKSTSGLR